jgi:hypothetical protein
MVTSSALPGRCDEDRHCQRVDPRWRREGESSDADDLKQKTAEERSPGLSVHELRYKADMTFCGANVRL